MRRGSWTAHETSGQQRHYLARHTAEVLVFIVYCSARRRRGDVSRGSASWSDRAGLQWLRMNDERAVG